MDWKKYIHSDPEILMGKPVVKGTRLAVDFLVGLFAAGWTEQQVLENYPSCHRSRFARFSHTSQNVCATSSCLSFLHSLSL